VDLRSFLSVFVEGFTYKHLVTLFLVILYQKFMGKVFNFGVFG
jgi:hypothetical protein